MSTRLSFLLVLACSPTLAADPVAGILLPDGFAMAEYAGPGLANDIYTLHIDARGRVVVAGRGYVRELVDTDGDGRADRAVELVTGLKGGPMGLLWEDEALFVVADGGLKRFTHVTSKTPVSVSETVIALRTGGEHDAHAVRRGPDGWLYLLCGNMAGVAKKHITGKNSPVKDPVAGCLVRLSPDGRLLEVVAHGFRNPYDFDFNLDGEVFTFDSDNERCIGLPWYEGCRFYHVRPGGHHGWLSPQTAQTWRRPPYFADVVQPVADLGRGSPTGVACYRHSQFPEKYHGGFFLADWTFGKIWFAPVTPKNDHFAGKPEVFLQATGEYGFAPTGLAVHPKTGELFVSIGGRGTRGGVYRIRSTIGLADPRPLPVVRRNRPTADPFVKMPAPTAQSLRDCRRQPVATRLALLRRLQLHHGDLTDPKLVGTVWEGYSFSRPQEDGAAIASVLCEQFPSGDRILDRELTRTLAALADADPITRQKVAARLTDQSDPVDDVHHLIVLGRLKSPPTHETTRRIADTLIRLDRKYEEHRLARESNWPLRLGETVTALLRQDPTLATAIVGHPGFAHPEHVWLARLAGIDRPAAARRFLARSTTDPDYRWTSGAVELLGALPDDELRPWLGKLWDRGGLEDGLIPLFARKPTPADRSRLITGLRSTSPPVVESAVKGLATLPGSSDLTELASLVQALRTQSADKATFHIRDRILALLRTRTGQVLDSGPESWEAWIAREAPAAAKLLLTPKTDTVAWKSRLAAVDWNTGDAKRGRRVFEKATCAACHQGNSAVGPSLEGATKRFSRDDLVTAILDPNRDVPPRYRATRIVTDDDRVLDGVIIYEAFDGIILQTGADNTVRVPGNRITSRRLLTTSPMPTGLLDRLTDRDLADLFEYLKTLGGSPMNR